MKEWRLKILSVVLAGMLWFAVSYMGDSEMSVSVRIATSGLGRDFVLKRVETDEAFVTISGPVSVLKRIRGRDIGISVDLSRIKEGRHVLSIASTDVQVPKGIQVKSIRPDYLFLEVDRLVEKRLKVVVKLDSKLTGKYKVRSLYPTYVTVEGARGALEGRTSIDTLPVHGPPGGEEDEGLYAGLDTKDLAAKSVRPDMIRVILRRY